ncbi:hypothetical protein AAF712_010980 [Marasmius tenuissimus]|uniref:Uncharacterized protein n=1 Tax=Marasmius tenuissimus TaxID=585030 RepID=A0ABR2ZL84_9AGAR
MTFPELISLGLYLNDDIGGGEPQIIPDSLINARKLYELTLSGDCDFRLLSAPPWGQITHFMVENLAQDPYWFNDNVADCVLSETLPRLTNVQHCSLEVYQDFSNFSGSSIVLPHLHTLVLTPGDVPINASSLAFNALTLPALRKLQIECDFPGPHGLFRFLNRSRCQLEEFEFVHGCNARATLLSHEELQSVRALKLPGYVGSYSEDLMDSIEALQYPSLGEETTQSIVLPNLVSLTFTRAEFDDGVEEANALVRMVSSRRNVDHLPSTVTRLQELIIQGETPFSIQDEATRAQLGKLCDEGLIFTKVRDC